MFRTYSVIYALQKLRPLYLNLGVSKLSKSTFKSHLSVDKLYPTSNPDFLRLHECQQSIQETQSQYSSDQASEKDREQREQFSGYIPVGDLEISASKSSGPGGQHVNKVNSKVEVRFHLESAQWIPDWIKPRLAEQEHGKITKDGYLVVRSDTTRKQMLNQAECMDRLRRMIHMAAQLPREPSQEEMRVKEERMAKAKAGILREKRNRSLLKRSRSDPGL